MHVVPPDPRLRGRWVRTSLTTSTGHRDETTEVTWLQAGELYVDLRGPAGAVSAGFAGRLVSNGGEARWLRTIDLLPPRATPDQGSLDVDGDDLVETGSDGSYVEHWRRTSPPTDPVTAVSLRRGDGHAVLVRVGQFIGWASAATTIEVSMGRLKAPGILLDRSNRADRTDLPVAWDGDGLVVDGRTWTVVALEGHADDLLTTPGSSGS